MKKPSLGLQTALFTFIRTITSTAYRMVYPFLPVFRDALGVPLDTLTYAVGARSLVAAFLGPLFASLGDLRGRKLGMLTGMLIFALGVSVVVFWPTFPGFVIALMLATVGKVTFDPTMQAYISDRVPYSRRSVALTITEFSWSGSFILGVPLIGWVIARTNWVGPFWLLGGLIILSAIWFQWRIPPDPHQADSRPGMLATFRTIFLSRPALAAMVLTLFSCAANELINLTFGVWLEDSFALKLAALGGTAAILGIAELGGESLVALTTDRLGKRRAIFLGLLLNSVAVIVLPFIGSSLLGADASLFVFYISFEFFIVSSIPLISEVMPNARTTMMAGFFTSASIGRALASLFSPSLYALGFGFTVAAAIGLNVLAMLSISALRVEAEESSLRI